MRRKKKKDKKSKALTALSKLFRIIVSIVLLTALILGISLLIERLSKLNSLDSLSQLVNNQASNLVDNSSSISRQDSDNKFSIGQDSNKKLMFKVCILSDIHEDRSNLLKAIDLVKDSGCVELFIIGDITNYGDTKTLASIKSVLDGSGYSYYSIPGDHDLAESVGSGNFKIVFGKDYRLVDLSGIKFMLVNNSANYTPIDTTQMAWIENNIASADIAILSQPLYTEGLNTPFNSIFMGSTNGSTNPNLKEKQLVVKDQGKLLLDLIRNSKNIKAVVTGEHHRSSELTDSVRADLKHFVIGAVTSVVNDYPQSAIQTSRFSILTFYEDKSFSMEDISID